jgi:hypothetical protein
VVGSVFFGAASSNGDYSLAFRHGLLLTIAFVLVALAVAIADVITARRAARS